MAPIRTAVIGCGHFGTYHARKYAASPAARLVAVVDRDPTAARALGATLGVTALGEPRALAGLVEAASVVVPTRDHFAVARELLTAGLHVLVEKPLAATLEEGRELIRLARARDRVLQVGHLERFNAAPLALGDVLGRPLFVESHRITPFTARGTDVDVVLDLMIHDIDLIQQLVAAPLVAVDAVGVPAVSARDDIANARLRFRSGCVANVTASRVSLRSERKLRLFQSDAYVSIDFLGGAATIVRRGEGETVAGLPQVALERRGFAANDPLGLEIEAFLAAIRGERPVAVSGEAGLRALATALEITRALRRPG